MNRLNKVLSTFAVAGAVAFTASHAHAVELLNDQFNDGNIATNPGIGGGFSGFDLGSVYESGGELVVSKGSGTPASAQSHKSFASPIGTTLTVVGRRTNDNFATISFGWVEAGGTFCCADEIYVELRTDRVVMDVQVGNSWQSPARVLSISAGSDAPNAKYQWDGTSPITASLTILADSWELHIIGTGVDIHQSGGYSDGWDPAAIANNIANNVDPTFRVALAAANGTAYFDSVVVTSAVVPEPASLALLGCAGLMVLRRRRH